MASTFIWDFLIRTGMYICKALLLDVVESVETFQGLVIRPVLVASCTRRVANARETGPTGSFCWTLSLVVH